MASGSLDSWLKRNITPKSRNLAKMKSWFKQIVEGTEYLHEKKFIHRDLKVRVQFFCSIVYFFTIQRFHISIIYLAWQHSII